MTVAWLREIEERDGEGDAVCTGRFECAAGERTREAVDDLPFEAALAWARARAERVYADVEMERYIVVGIDRTTPPLPPELAERLAAGPRRPARDAWRDRPETAAPMRWEVRVHLAPPNPWDVELEGVVGEAVERLVAAGCHEVSSSSDELDAARAEFEAKARRAGNREIGWTTSHLLAFVLTGSTEAPAYRPVAERVRRAVGAPAGWRVHVAVQPPGYERRPPLL